MTPNCKAFYDSMSRKDLEETRADLALYADENAPDLAYIDARLGVSSPPVTTKASPEPSRVNCHCEMDPAVVAAAYHESAHGVAAVVFGVTLFECRIHPNGSGQVTLDFECLAPGQRIALARVGKYSERKAGFARPDDAYMMDRHHEHLALCGVYGGDRLAAEREGELLADKILRERWPAITAVANQLLLCDGTLSGAEIQRIVESNYSAPARVGRTSLRETIYVSFSSSRARTNAAPGHNPSGRRLQSSCPR